MFLRPPPLPQVHKTIRPARNRLYRLIQGLEVHVSDPYQNANVPDLDLLVDRVWQLRATRQKRLDDTAMRNLFIAGKKERHEALPP